MMIERLGATMDIAKSYIDNLTKEELEAFQVIATKVKGGDLSLLGELYNVDYEEIPVTIDQFLEDERYLGLVYDHGKLIYPFWRETLHKVFHENADNAFEVIFTGCLTGDTIIPLLDGTNPTIEELYFTRNKEHYVYSFDTAVNRYTVGKTSDIMCTGIKPVYKITLDTGESIKATSNHKFLTRDKHWISLDKGLTIGTSLMPFNRHLDDRGYEILQHPQKDGTFIEEPTHRVSMRYKHGGAAFRGVVHHKNFKKQDNTPENLLLTNWSAHRHYHALKGAMKFTSYNAKLRDKTSKEYIQSVENCKMAVKSYNHKVVSIEYLGDEVVYDMTVPKYHNFVTGSGVVAHNCIGSGKSTISTIGMMYLMYRTLCLRNPQEFYGLAANSPIVFVCMNLTLELANTGLYTTIVEAMKMSPWFQEKVNIRGKYDFSISFPKNIQLTCASQTQHTIGKNVLGAILDELNFNNAPKGSKNSVLDMYRNIRRRLESRFLKQGRIPGFLFLVSSKNNELSFLEQYIDTIRNNKTAYIVDRAIYDIKPPETYTGPRFKVAVGDKTKSSRILSDTEDPSMLEELGYQVINVPVEYKIAFEQDINEALKDISGISGVSTNKLIPYAGKIEHVVSNKRKSPFMVDQIILDLDSEDEIKDFLDDIRILKKDIHIPRFIHCDLGLKNDQTGLSMVHSDNRTSVERYTKDGKILSLIEQHYTQDFTIGIKASAGSEVPIYKIRNFIIWLATSLGLQIQTVSFDGFQSSDSLQLLKIAGIDTKLVSMDRTPDPYLSLRACILEDRLELYNHRDLIKELYDLEYDRRLNKVDHPLEGSKDLADSLCGALWDAQEYYVTQAPKSPGVVQHDNVKQAVKFLNDFNKKRWVPDNVQDLSDDTWLTSDYKS